MVHAYINNAYEIFEDTKSVNWKTENTMTNKTQKIQWPTGHRKYNDQQNTENTMTNRTQKIQWPTEQKDKQWLTKHRKEVYKLNNMVPAKNKTGVKICLTNVIVIYR